MYIYTEDSIRATFVDLVCSEHPPK